MVITNKNYNKNSIIRSIISKIIDTSLKIKNNIDKFIIRSYDFLGDASLILKDLI